MNYYDPSYQNGTPTSASPVTISQVMRQVYLKMFLALAVSAAAAYVCAAYEPLRNLLYSPRFVFYGLVIVELILVFSVSRALTRGMSASKATFLFYLYAIINGLTLSCVLLLYTPASIAMTFLITAGVFAAMSVYGYCTTRDLSGIGSFLFMALIGLIICSVVNWFVGSSTLEWIVSFAGVAIFIGLTAWDTQKIKVLMMTCPGRADQIATLGALSLYLDFINLFLYLLRFFGRDN